MLITSIQIGILIIITLTVWQKSNDLVNKKKYYLTVLLNFYVDHIYIDMHFIVVQLMSTQV